MSTFNLIVLKVKLILLMLSLKVVVKSLAESKMPAKYAEYNVVEIIALLVWRYDLVEIKLR